MLLDLLVFAFWLSVVSPSPLNHSTLFPVLSKALLGGQRGLFLLPGVRERDRDPAAWAWCSFFLLWAIN